MQFAHPAVRCDTANPLFSEPKFATQRLPYEPGWRWRSLRIMLQEKTRPPVSCPACKTRMSVRRIAHRSAEDLDEFIIIARCAISKQNNKFPIFQDRCKARPKQLRADGNRSSTQRNDCGRDAAEETKRRGRPFGRVVSPTRLWLSRSSHLPRRGARNFQRKLIVEAN